jgi:hypothetical protein
MRKWTCSEEQAQLALDHHWHTGQPLTTVRAMRAAITTAIGPAMDRQRARTLRVVEIARRLRAERNNAERERDEALSLAYVGEHRFPDNTYKEMLSRCAFVMRKTARERDEAQAMVAELVDLLTVQAGGAQRWETREWHVGTPKRALVEAWRADAEEGPGR